jgi:hypothetical protein
MGESESRSCTDLRNKKWDDPLPLFSQTFRNQLLDPERKRKKRARKMQLPEEKGVIPGKLLKAWEKGKKRFPFSKLIISEGNPLLNGGGIPSAKDK